MDVQQRARRPSNFLRFLSYVKPYRGYLILAIVGGIVKFTVPLLVPELTRYLLDHVFLNPELTTPAKLRELFLYTGGLAAIFIFFWGPWTYARHYYAGMAGQRSVFDLRCDLYYRILRMSASFFTRNKSGGIVSRLISDIELIQNLVGSAMTNIWMDTAALFVILAFLLRIDPVITLVALVTFPLYLYFFNRYQREIRASAHQVQQGISTLSGNVQEKIAGSTVVRAFTQEKREELAFHQDARQLFNRSMRSVHLQSANVAITGVLTQIAPLIVFLYGGYAVITGGLTVGELVAVTMLLGPLYLPLQRFTDLNVVFANSMAALDRVYEILDDQPEVRERPGAIELTGVRGKVAFRNVSFAYEEKAPVLNDVNFTVQPGLRVALVGPSGSGKSTIISLIPRFYDVKAGAVEIDDIDVRDVQLRSLRQSISMVLQTPVLFSGTIKENILYGRPKASDEEVSEACRAANALDFIRALPRGFDSEVGEGGAFLSGGQRQRITIARAFLKNPKILILDEATSALDTESERLIQGALERLMEGRTTFIIAHRLSTIRNADTILVLDGGSLIDAGTHAQLLSRPGLYRTLYENVELTH
jgi:ABC-type multidrug transport system fused ATPase/permease subunit